jgi:hypothetical protein
MARASTASPIEPSPAAIHAPDEARSCGDGGVVMREPNKHCNDAAAETEW